MDTNTKGKIYTLHLFAGAGGGILADLLLGHTPIGAVEIEAYPRKVLLARQLDGSLPRFPIWDDVCTFRQDNPETSGFIERLKGIRDNLCVCGGFPCQDISAAGKGAGIDGERSGLWREFARIIGEIRPRYAFVENSSMLTIRGLGRVLGDLAEMGYDARWGVLGACHTGKLHERDRLWCLGYSNKMRLEGNTPQHYILNAIKAISESMRTKQTCDDLPKPYHIRGSDGVAYRVDRLIAIGNGQCPQSAALAFRILSESCKFYHQPY